MMATGTQDELSNFHAFLSRKLASGATSFHRKKHSTCGERSILTLMTIPAMLRR